MRISCTILNLPVVLPTEIFFFHIFPKLHPPGLFVVAMAITFATAIGSNTPLAQGCG